MCEKSLAERGAPAKAGEERVAIRPVAFKHLRQKENPVTSFPLLFHCVSPRISCDGSCQGEPLFSSLLLRRRTWSDSPRGRVCGRPTGNKLPQPPAVGACLCALRECGRVCSPECVGVRHGPERAAGARVQTLMVSSPVSLHGLTCKRCNNTAPPCLRLSRGSGHRNKNTPL